MHGHVAEHRRLIDRVVEWLTTTSAHRIGLMYIGLGIINFVLAGAAAYLFRINLAASEPGSPILDPNLYYWLMSLHGLVMLLLFATQVLVGLANLLVPKLIGAPDLYWPRINALSFWMQVPATILMWSSIFSWSRGPGPGWTLYPPLSAQIPALGVDLVLMAILIGGVSSTLTGLNLILTILRLRRPDIPMVRMSLFAWSILAMAILLVAAMPPLAVGAIMLLLERHLGSPFFDPIRGGDPLLFQNVFWFFGHPEVYILVLPAMGLVSEVVQRLSGRRAYGYTAIAVSSVAIAAISFGVWIHHMFTALQLFVPRIVFAAMTMAVAIPSGIKVFNWIATMFYSRRIRLEPPMLFAISFIAFFIVGGVTGVFFPVITLDLHLQDTYFVLGHFHYVVNAIVLGAMAAIYYYYPHITGRWYTKRLAMTAWLMYTIGGALTYTSMLYAGVLGMPRRYAASPSPIYDPWHQLMTLGTVLIGIGTLAFIIDLIYSARYGRPVENRSDPWGTARIGLPDIVEPAVKHHEERGTAWPAVIGIGTGVLGLGLVAALAGLVHIGLLAILAFVAMGAAWMIHGFVLPGIRVARLSGLGHLDIPKPPSRLGDAKMSIYWVVFSEATIFGTLISSAIYTRVVRFETWDAAISHLPQLVTPLILAMSILLYLSSLTGMAARRAFMRGDMRRFYLWGGVTLAIGAAFALVQFLVEFPTLVAEGFAPGSNIFSAYFYAIVTAHGFHVVIGVVLWALALALAKTGYWNPRRPAGIEAAEIYWHFVDVVWLVVFPLMYLGLIHAIPPAAAIRL